VPRRRRGEIGCSKCGRVPEANRKDRGKIKSRYAEPGEEQIRERSRYRVKSEGGVNEVGAW